MSYRLGQHVKRFCRICPSWYVEGGDIGLSPVNESKGGIPPTPDHPIREVYRVESLRNDPSVVPFGEFYRECLTDCWHFALLELV
jgi:hypothetical protein